MIETPFTLAQVQALNEAQLHLHIDPLRAIHPFTCANRGDGSHGEEGGDLGVLIATPGGWVCPHCDDTQNFAHDAMAQCLDVKDVNVTQVAQRLRTYEALYRADKFWTDGSSPNLGVERQRRAVATMLVCLHRAAMAAYGVETRPGHTTAAAEDRLSASSQAWSRGYYAAVALLLREEGCVTSSVKSLYQQGGGAEFADEVDAELFRAHGLISSNR